MSWLWKGREDDNLETIKKRFKVFVESTLPIVSYYESKGKLRKVRTWFFFFSMIVTITCCSTILILIFFLKINAAKPSQEVFEEVKYVFASETWEGEACARFVQTVFGVVLLDILCINYYHCWVLPTSASQTSCRRTKQKQRLSHVLSYT